MILSIAKLDMFTNGHIQELSSLVIDEDQSADRHRRCKN